MHDLSRIAATAALALGLGTVAQAQTAWTPRQAPAANDLGADDMGLAIGRSVYIERAPVDATQKVMGLSVPNGPETHGGPAIR